MAPAMSAVGPKGGPPGAGVIQSYSRGGVAPRPTFEVAVQRTVYVFSGAMYQPTRLSASVYALANAAIFFPASAPTSVRRTKRAEVSTAGRRPLSAYCVENG